MSRIVLGGGSFLEIPLTQLEEICTTAKEIGVLRIDTSPCYGNSERAIGEVLYGDRGFKIKTKICNPVSGILSRSDVLSSVQLSLKNLKLEKIECLLLHELSFSQVEQGALEALLELKKAGITDKIGVSSDNESLALFAEIGMFDTFMGTINLLDLSNLETMRKLSNNPENTLIAKRALANGVWRKDVRYRLLKYYRTIKQEIDFKDQQSYLSRHKRISNSLGRTLIKSDYMNFAFSWDTRAEILIGTRRANHLKEFRSAEESERLSASELANLESHWKNESSLDWRAHV